MPVPQYLEAIAYAETQDQMERLRRRTLDSPMRRGNLLAADEVAMRWAFYRLWEFESATRDLLDTLDGGFSLDARDRLEALLASTRTPFSVRYRPPDRPCPQCGNRASGFSVTNGIVHLVCCECRFAGPGFSADDPEHDRLAWEAWQALERPE